MKRFHTSIVIAAPAERIWDILTDAGSYPAWNTTVTKVEGTIAAGEKVTVHAKISPDRAFPVKVTEFVPQKRMRWTGGMPLGLFKGERVFALRPVEGDALAQRFEMTEEFSGLLAGLIGKSIPDLQPEFDKFAECLKQAAEGNAAPA